MSLGTRDLAQPFVYVFTEGMLPDTVAQRVYTGMVAESIHWLAIHLSDHTVRCFAMLACSALLCLRIGQDAGSAEEILFIYFWFR